VQHYVLIAANSGLRVGEQRQLRWSDVQIEQHKVNGELQKLARIHIRAETSKVPTSRTFLCRNGQYFERLREISKPKSARYVAV
jgi:integrase